MSAGDALAGVVIPACVVMFGWLPARAVYRAVRRWVCRAVGCPHETGTRR